MIFKNRPKKCAPASIVGPIDFRSPGKEHIERMLFAVTERENGRRIAFRVDLFGIDPCLYEGRENIIWRRDAIAKS